MPVIHVKTEAEFDEYVNKSKDENTLLVVDFSAAWCGPCRAIEPKITKMSEDYSQVTFLKVDVDEVASLAARCGISAMPTFHFYKAGEKIGEVVGANEEAVKNLVNKHV